MMRTRVALSVVAALASGMCAQAPIPQTDLFAARTYAAGSVVMPYRLFVPENYDKAKQYPLLVWLHGAGGRGTDNIQQISGDQVPGTRLWTTKRNQDKHPAFVVAPQSRSAWTLPRDVVDLQPEPRLVGELLDMLAAAYPIDQRRVYLLAQSMGGGGAWNLV